jgi:hypothetical protein
MKLDLGISNKYRQFFANKLNFYFLSKYQRIDFSLISKKWFWTISII